MSRGVAVRLYGRLLLLLPAWFRAGYGAEMQRMFADQWGEARSGLRVRLAARALFDVGVTAVRVRFTGDGSSHEAHVPVRNGWLSGALFDGLLAVRTLRRRPQFAFTAIGTLGLGIGATAAVFSVVDATVLRALRYPDAERIVWFWSTFTDQGGNEFALSAAEYTDLREARSFELVGGYSSAQTTLEGFAGGAARTVTVAFTLGDVYRIVGARTSLGRLPGPDDDRLSAPLVAVLSHGLWSESYGGDPSVVGTRTIQLGTQQALIIGVLAPETELPAVDADAWVHWVPDPASWAANRSGHGIEGFARLAEGASPSSAAAELAGLEHTWAERYAGQHGFGLNGHGLSMAPLGDRLLGTTRRTAWLLAGASALLLILACANVANLLLARGETRSAEVGVRIALGASGSAVGRPVLMEGLVLGLAGGITGAGLAAAGLPTLLRMAPDGMAGLDAVSVNGRVVLFAVAVSLMSGMLFAIAPAISAARRDPAQLLRAAGRGRTAAGRGLRIMVAGQTALATLLLAMAGLLTRSLLELNSIDPGFDANSRVTLDLTLPADRFPDRNAVIAFYDAVRDRVGGLPGVETVGITRTLPLRDAQRNEYVLREGDAAAEDRVGVSVLTATPGTLNALGVPLVEGRDLSDVDGAEGARVVLLNRAAAQTLWPGESAVGRRLRPTFAPADWGVATVVGVYENVRGGGLAAVPAPEVMLPLAQFPNAGYTRTGTVVVHGSGEPTATLTAARAAIVEINRDVPVESPTALIDVVRASTARERFIATLIQVFAALALAIAGVGVYGVVSFSGARQGRELAIRNALGAKRSDLLLRMLRETVMMAGLGTLAGSALVLIASPGLAAFLYGVAPRDALVLVGVPLTLMMFALLSSLAPALRATRIAPAAVLQDSD
jgi:putative ABC transport system permease protein